MTVLLFENLWLLAFVLIVAELALVSAWFWRRTARWAQSVWLGLALGLLLMITSWGVVTAREAVAKCCRDLVSWVESEDIGAIESALATTFEADGMDREAFAAWVGRGLLRFDFAQARVGGLDIRLSTPDHCVSAFRVGCRIESADSGGAWIRTGWEIMWIRHADRWRMVGVKPIPIAPLHLQSLQQMFR